LDVTTATTLIAFLDFLGTTTLALISVGIVSVAGTTAGRTGGSITLERRGGIY
jgi:hypothetical protein